MAFPPNSRLRSGFSSLPPLLHSSLNFCHQHFLLHPLFLPSSPPTDVRPTTSSVTNLYQIVGDHYSGGDQILGANTNSTPSVPRSLLFCPCSIRKTLAPRNPIQHRNPDLSRRRHSRLRLPRLLPQPRTPAVHVEAAAPVDFCRVGDDPEWANSVPIRHHRLLQTKFTSAPEGEKSRLGYEDRAAAVIGLLQNSRSFVYNCAVMGCSVILQFRLGIF